MGVGGRVDGGEYWKQTGSEGIRLQKLGVQLQTPSEGFQCLLEEVWIAHVQKVRRKEKEEKRGEDKHCL